MRLLSGGSFAKICDECATHYVSLSLFDGFEYECVCGSTHIFQDEHTIYIRYEGDGLKIRLTVSCPEKEQHLTLLELKLREGVFPEGFVSLAGYIAGNKECDDYENEYYETLNAEPWIQNLWRWEEARGITVFPRNKYDLIHLQELDFGSYEYLEHTKDEEINDLPREIFKLPHLKKLRLGSATNSELYLTNLNELPCEVGQLTSLECLYVQFNSLEALPTTIENLTELKDLKLGCNRLTKLPKEIGKLKKLETLTLWRNNLTCLPEELCELVQLKGLDITGNQLKSLPDGIVNLTNLQTLYIGNDLKLTQTQKKWLNDLEENDCEIDFY